MSRLISNFAANAVSAAATAAIAILLIPLYVRVVGVEAYGLIGFYLALRAFLLILDLGAGAVVNREVARLTARGSETGEGRDALHTFQGLYWIVGALLGILIVVLAPQIAERWLRAEALPREEVAAAVRLMGLLIAIQWPATFYQNALLGLERQVVLSAVLTTASIATHVGALAAMLTLSPRVEVFFFSGILISALQIVTLAILYRRSVRFEGAATFRLSALRHVARFAAGAGAISVTGSILAHSDKVLLSSMLSLEQFAHYSLAATVAGALVIVVTPIFNTFYPRYSSLIASGREGELRDLHHFGTQLVTMAVVPAALTVVFFSRDVVEAWTRNAATAAAVAPIAVLLILAAAINGLMILPYALQLAHGWTRAGTVFGISAVAVYLPLIASLASAFGAVGGASGWLILNLVYFFMLAPLTHAKLLPRSLREWLVSDIAAPTAAAAAIIAASALLSRPASEATRLVHISGTYVAAATGAAFTARRFREWLVQRLAPLRRR
ncbi:MAG TPA: oligosaccharide flippase family protein [Thermoanaerobaculia bacterium]|jgi:O-antigen/teichoic acid export membrane protein